MLGVDVQMLLADVRSAKYMSTVSAIHPGASQYVTVMREDRQYRQVTQPQS